MNETPQESNNMPSEASDLEMKTDLILDNIIADAKAETGLNDFGDEAMAAWETENAQHKHGKRGYSLEETGLTEEEIRNRLVNYSQYFDQYLR